MFHSAECVEEPVTTLNAYKDSTSAYIALQFLKQKQIKSFEISSNERKSADLVLKINNKLTEKQAVLALHFKHVPNSKGAITNDSLTAQDGSFSLFEYFNCFKANGRRKFFLYTNGQFDDQNQDNILDLKQFHVNITLHRNPEFDFMNTCHSSQFCKFKIVTGSAKNISDEQVTEWRDFFEKFYLFSNQMSLEEINQSIEVYFEISYNQCGENCWSDYLNFVRRVSKNAILDEETVRAKICEILLSPYVSTIDFHEDFRKFNIFRETCSSSDVIIIGTGSRLGGIYENWRQKFWDVAEVNRVGLKFGLLSKKITKQSEVDEGTLLKILWHSKKISLPIVGTEENKAFVYRAIQVCLESSINRKFLLVGDEFKETEPDWTGFLNLSSLYADPENFKQVWKTCELRIQGDLKLFRWKRDGGA